MRLLNLVFLVPLESLYGASPELIGPFGGSAAIVQVDSARPGTLIAATSNALLFRSADGGDSWARLHFPAELRATLHALAIDARSGTYLAGLASGNPQYSGIFLSQDAGQTWTSLPSLTGKDIWSIAIFPSNPRIIAAGGTDGVYLTLDGGEHWSRISPESNRALMPVVSIDFDPTDFRVLYAGTPHLPWRTTDGGMTWRSVHAGMLDDSDVFSIHVDASLPSRVFASACSGIYCSRNRAISWTKLARPRDASYRTYQIAQHPTRSNVLFAGTTQGLVKSTDGGITWRKLSAYATRWIAFDPARPNRIYTATDEVGLFRSDDLGESLQPINEGFCNRHVFSVGALGSTLYATSASGFGGSLFRQINPGEPWEIVGSGSLWRAQQILKVLPINPTHLYLLTSQGLLLSSDDGRSWNNIGPSSGAKLTAVLAQSFETRLLVSSDKGIYYSDNDGVNWQAAHMSTAVSSIRSLSSMGPRSVAAISSSAVLISSDGTDYEAVTPPVANGEIHALIVTDHADLIAATSHGLKRSEDFGQTWQSVQGILGNSTVSALCKHPTRRGLLFAARYGVIFSSTDDGLTWAPLTSEAEELPSIRELIVPSGTPSSLFAVTNSNGIYSLPLDGVSWIECHGRYCDNVQVRIY